MKYVGNIGIIKKRNKNEDSKGRQEKCTLAESLAGGPRPFSFLKTGGRALECKSEKVIGSTIKHKFTRDGKSM